MEPMKPMKPMERMEPIAASRWWPEELGAPDSSGSQDGWRYAYFPQRHVLAVERGGHVTQYDTGDHEIAGVSQTQGRTDAGPVFRSQKGELHLDTRSLRSSRSFQDGARLPRYFGRRAAISESTAARTRDPTPDIRDRVRRPAGVRTHRPRRLQAG